MGAIGFFLRVVASGAVLQIALSDVVGAYSFSGVAPDSYFIEVVPPAGLDVTAMDVGTLDDIDSDFDGEFLTTDDFIFSPSASGLDFDCGFTTSGGP